MKVIRYIVGAGIILSACGHGSKSTSEKSTPVPEKAVTAVCVYTKDAVQKKPEKNARYLSSLMLGEVMNYLGKTENDSTDKARQYYYVQLSDGSKVWARTYGVLLNAYPAAVMHTTPIYERPELVTKTDKVFHTMEFVAVTNEKNDWVEVTGKDKHKKGWIKKENISANNDDVAVSTLAERQILDKNGELEMDKIASFLDDLPYKNSRLVVFLKGKLSEENVQSAVQDSIQSYENNKNARDSE